MAEKKVTKEVTAEDRATAARFHFDLRRKYVNENSKEVRTGLGWLRYIKGIVCSDRFDGMDWTDVGYYLDLWLHSGSECDDSLTPLDEYARKMEKAFVIGPDGKQHKYNYKGELIYASSKAEACRIVARTASVKRSV